MRAYRLSSLIFSVSAICACLVSYPGEVEAGTSQSRGSGPTIDQKDLKVRVTSVLAELIRSGPPEELELRVAWIHSLTAWPWESVEAHVAKQLKDRAVDVVLAASDILSKRDRAKYKNEIVALLHSLNARTFDQQAAKDVILLRLGDESVLNRVRLWARMAPRISEKIGTYTCPVHTQISSRQDGSCPICGLPLLRFSHPATIPQDGILLALEELAERGDAAVEEVAKGVLVSDSSSARRMRAAIQWGRLSPKESLPYLRLFLMTPSDAQVNSVSEIGQALPQLLIDELNGLAFDEMQLSEIRVAAAAALAKNGDDKALEILRQLVQTPRQGTSNSLARFNAIMFLGEFGTTQDIALLAPLLDSNLKHIAAPSILRIMSRTSTNP